LIVQDIHRLGRDILPTHAAALFAQAARLAAEAAFS
jgi:hypothetical protein